MMMMNPRRSIPRILAVCSMATLLLWMANAAQAASPLLKAEQLAPLLASSEPPLVLDASPPPEIRRRCWWTR